MHATHDRRVHAAVTRSRICNTKRPMPIAVATERPESAAAPHGQAADTNDDEGQSGVSGATRLPATAPAPATKKAAATPAAHGGNRPAGGTLGLVRAAQKPTPA